MKRRRSAFTLVELLIVIGIIAVLISLLLPALGAARRQGRNMACLSNLKQIGYAAMLYAQANNGWLPPGDNSPSGQDYNWPLALAPYAGGKNSITGNGTVVWPKIYRCPSAGKPHDGNYHYAANPLVMPDLTRTMGFSNFTGYPNPPYLRQYRLVDVKPPTTIMLFFDAQQTENNNWNCYKSAWQINNGLSTTDRLFYEEQLAPGRNDTPLAYKWSMNKEISGAVGTAEMRYREGKNNSANAVFADGHAETHTIGNKDATNALCSLKQSNLRPKLANTKRGVKPTTTQW